MSRRSLALIGAGNIRCCPSVLASIAALGALEDLDIRLYDANQERLDLYFQLAGTIMDLSDREHDLLPAPVPAEETAAPVEPAEVSETTTAVS